MGSVKKLVPRSDHVLSAGDAKSAKEKRRRMWSVISLTIAAMVLPNAAYADDGGARLPNHNWPVFVSGATTGTTQSSVPSLQTFGEKPKKSQTIKQKNPMEYVDQLGGVRAVWQARVLIIPFVIVEDTMGVIPPSALGCTFVNRDPSRIANLLELLRRANIHDPFAGGAAYHWESADLDREEISLSFANGTQVQFSFGVPTMITGNVEGYFRMAHGQKQYVVADRLLAKALYLWARETGGLRRSAYCDRTSIESGIKILKKWPQPRLERRGGVKVSK